MEEDEAVWDQELSRGANALKQMREAENDENLLQNLRALKALLTSCRSPLF